MDSLRTEIETELKRTRLDKTRLYSLLPVFQGRSPEFRWCEDANTDVRLHPIFWAEA